MSIWRLIVREMVHRRLGFMIGVLSVLVAAAILVAELTLLERHDRNTDAIVARTQAQTHRLVQRVRAETQQRAARLNDDMRKIMRSMGFNVFILPKDQELSDFYSDGYCSKFMPESYVVKLASSRLITVRHLLPILEQKVRWPEQGGRKIVLVGTRGEVPITHKTAKTPMLDPVLPGQIVMGYELWRGASLEVGSKVTLLGRDFKLVERYGERGTKDDITVWINLAEAQEMLDLKGKISAILALECRCAWADAPKVRQEITSILPDTWVREIRTKALARAEARNRSAEQGEEALRAAQEQGAHAIDQARAHRVKMRAEIEAFASVTVPLTIIGCAAWVMLLAYANVRQRRGEIAILRAIGFRSGQIASVVLVRALLIGLFGGVLGASAGMLVGSVAAEAPVAEAASAGAFDGVLLATVALGAPVLCVLASWAPAVLAGRQDPAVILQQE